VSAYVLVHGGSADGSIWDPVRVLLESRGNRCLAPSLSDERTGSLSAHTAEVCSVLKGSGLDGIVLVGHSYGGMVITGVADRMPEAIGRLIYVDAALPDPGQSLFDLFRAGGFDPLSFAGLDPYPPYLERLSFRSEVLAGIPKTYIRCTQSVFAGVGEKARDKVMRRMREDNWAYRELTCDHKPMLSVPDRLVEVL
jgi:pimeloyl-ACP methyl ester carboxylesterase